MCRSSVSPPLLGSRRRAPDSEPGAGTELWAKGASLQVQMRASATHHYYIVVPSALQRRGAGSGRGGFTSSTRASLQFPKLPQLLGAGEPPAPASALPGPPALGLARPGRPLEAPPRPPDPERGPAARCGGTGPSELARSPPERGRRVREEHCSPIRQLTGKRMEGPPPPWLLKPVEMGKVTGTEMPFSPLPPQSQRRLQRKNKLVLVPNFSC